MGRWAQARKRGSDRIHPVAAACTCHDALAAEFDVTVTVVLGVGSFSVRNLTNLDPCYGSWSAELDLDGDFVESVDGQGWGSTWTPIATGASGQTWAIKVSYNVGTCPETDQAVVASGEVS